MQNTQKLLDITIFSNQSFIIDYCNNKLKDYGFLSVSNSLEHIHSNKNSLLIVDALAIKDIYRALSRKSVQFLENTLCLIPQGCNSSILDFCEKHFLQTVYFPTSFDAVVYYCRKLIETIDSSYFVDVCKMQPSCTDYFVFFRGSSKLISDVRARISEAALNEEPVLLLGETGTGKTTAANVIHRLSCRSRKTMKVLNVPAIVDSLASSSLFGTENGAYTDAPIQDGIFKTATESTLFFDEIGGASQKVQSILLDAIESGRIKSVGSDKDEIINVRMIFATNSNLKSMIEEGNVRLDFFQRISDNIIYFPSLRERKEDIRQIVYGLLENRNVNISENAMKKLESYDWPGNIRELDKCIKRAVRNGEGNLIQEHNVEFNLFYD